MTDDEIDESNRFTIHHGFCWQVHKAKPLKYECFGSFVNIVKGLLCIVMFIYILAKMNKNHRRALAGYTKNTINIDVHMTMMQILGFWTICWGVLKVFDITNTKEDQSHARFTRDERMFASAHCFCFAISSFVEAIILLLLCSTSIGQNNFFRSWFVASFWGISTFFTMIFVIVLQPGPESEYWISRNMEWALLTRDILTIAFNLAAVCFFVYTKSDRLAILRFAKYMIAMYTALAIARGCQLSIDYVVSNFGICSLDLSELVHFFTFAPVVYLTLKRDCQYWSTDVDDDEEDTLIKHTNEMTWSELPNYKDVVIPKTELFYRSKLMDQVDVTVEIHLWRRKLAVVKRFKFDLLTRDNIKFFKVEANIFKRLSHENIVDFYGVLIDPPSLGIVMKYCSKGDVFKRIEKEREALEQRLLDHTDRSCMDRRDTVNGSVAPPSEINTTNRSSLMVTDIHVIQSFKAPSLGGYDDDNSSANPLRVGSGPVDESHMRESQRVTSIWKMGTSSKLGGFRASIMGHKSSVDLVPIDRFEPLVCALQVANGMNYLHSQNITHRDLKSMNVLLDENYNAKIADFGESIMDRSGRNQGNKMPFHNKATFVGEMGTAGWAAPEMILGRGASPASDVFSYGIVLWELLTWRVPSVMISVRMLQEESLRCHSSTFEHPLLEIIRQQRTLPKDQMPPSSFLDLFGGHGSATSSASSSRSHLSSGKVLNKQTSDKNLVKSLTDGDSSDEGRPRGRSSSFSGKAQQVVFSVERANPSASKRKSNTRRSMANLPAERQEAESSGGEFRDSGRSGTSAVYDRKSMAASTIRGQDFATVSDDDLTMVEVSDMRIAEELFCKRHLRPPMPVGIPDSLLGLIQRCWSVDPRQRPSFPDIIAELDRVILQQGVNFEIPCEVEARINYASDADRSVLGSDYVVV